MSTCTATSIDTDRHAYIHIHILTYKYTYIHIHTFIYTYTGVTYTDIRIYTYTCKYTRMCINIHTRHHPMTENSLVIRLLPTPASSKLSLPFKSRPNSIGIRHSSSPLACCKLRPAHSTLFNLPHSHTH